MYKYLIFFLLVSATAHAQINFWTTNDIIDKQLQPERKALKIKTAYSYATNEYWRVSDSTEYEQITEYNTAGQKTAVKVYKTDWAKNKRYMSVLDSFFYNEKGVFILLKRYEPQNDGQYYALVYVLKSILDKKGRIEKMEAYSGYNAEELESYNLYTYDSKNRVSKITTYRHNGDTEKTAFIKDMTYTFDYDKKGLPTKAKAAAGEGFTEYRMRYNDKGLLANYTEWYNGTELQNETNYTYDDRGRATQRNYTTTHDYNDTIQYWYEGDKKIPYRTYLTYPRMNGKEYAHHYTVYKFDYYE